MNSGNSGLLMRSWNGLVPDLPSAQRGEEPYETSDHPWAGDGGDTDDEHPEGVGSVKQSLPVAKAYFLGDSVHAFFRNCAFQGESPPTKILHLFGLRLVSLA